MRRRFLLIGAALIAAAPTGMVLGQQAPEPDQLGPMPQVIEPGQPPPPQPPEETQEPPPAEWVAQTAAVLRVLNKIDATSAMMTVAVGRTAQFGALTLGVQSCLVRPANMVADAAAYLVITDKHADDPAFRGWVLANEPWVSMLQSPLYDVRLVGCRT